jgi:hypothetical protein
LAREAEREISFLLRLSIICSRLIEGTFAVFLAVYVLVQLKPQRYIKKSMKHTQREKRQTSILLKQDAFKAFKKKNNQFCSNSRRQRRKTLD